MKGEAMSQCMKHANAVFSGGHMSQPTYHSMKLLSLSNKLAKWAVIYVNIFFEK